MLSEFSKSDFINFFLFIEIFYKSIDLQKIYIDVLEWEDCAVSRTDRRE